MSEWERQYSLAVADIAAPTSLDEKIFAQAKTFKPIKPEKRMLSKVASGMTAVAIAVVLLHPAQYLGALTPEPHSPLGKTGDAMAKWRPKATVSSIATDEWYSLRAEVNAGNYVTLCNQWRQQQRSDSKESFPRDLAGKAREHCRLLNSQ